MTQTAAVRPEPLNNLSHQFIAQFVGQSEQDGPPWCDPLPGSHQGRDT
jgi:hypothetical protein